MKLDVDDVIRRVRDEISRRGDGPAMSDPASAIEGPNVVWTTIVGSPPMKAEYSLGELLATSDRAFVESAYMAVLRRAPDPQGAAHYVEKLRSGELSKVDVLAQLRWSPEGRTRSVHVDGLLAPAKLHEWRRKRVVGPLIRWAHAVLRLPSLLHRASRVEAVLSGETQELGRVLNRLSTQVRARITSDAVAQAAVNSRLESQIAEGRSQLELLEARVAELVHGRSQLEQLEARVADLTQRQSLLEEVIRTCQTAIEGQGELMRNEHLQQLVALEARIEGRRELMAAELASQRAQLAAHDVILSQIALAEESHKVNARALDSLYVAFEERFRGSRDLVRMRALPYLDIVRAAGAGTHDAPVLDIGSGRGDWLDILREHGLVARGVDSNQVFLDICRGRGLDVIEGDVLQVLRGLDDSSVGAITGMHIAEHLPFEVLIELLDEAKRILRIGGVLMLETPNPENLWVATHWFYMDPTHRNPLPPEALRWLVEARGFGEVRIERQTIARELPAPPLLETEMPGAASVNVLLGQLHAAPDYAIVARRIQ